MMKSIMLYDATYGFSSVIGPFVLLIRSCAQHIAASFWRMEVAQVVEKMDNARKEET
jgi:hypothetical protein